MEDLNDYKMLLIKKIQEEERKRKGKIEKLFIPDNPKAKPFMEQKRFLCDPAPTKLLRCGNRAAKTFTSMRDHAYKVMRNHPYRKDWNCDYETSRPKTWWILGPTFEFITKVAWNEYLSKFIPEWYYTSPEGKRMIETDKHKGQEYVSRVTFRNGDVIEFRTYSQNILAQMGRAVDGAIFDEMPPSIKLLSEVMVRCFDNDGEVVFGFTPLVENEEIKEYLDNHPSISTHCWSVLANPIYRDNPQRRERLLNEYASLPENLRRARINGEWYYDSDDTLQVFSNVVPQVVDDFIIPMEWRQIRFIDPAAHVTGAIIAAEDPDTGTWYVHKAMELFWKGVYATSEHIENELEKHRPYEGFEYFYSKYDNHECWFQAHAKGNWTPCVDKNKKMGITAARDALNSGKVKVFKIGGALLLQQIQLYRRKETGEIIKKNDHCLDSFMYFCREIPPLSDIPVQPDSDDRAAIMRYHMHKIMNKSSQKEEVRVTNNRKVAQVGRALRGRTAR